MAVPLPATSRRSRCYTSDSIALGPTIATPIVLDWTQFAISWRLVVCGAAADRGNGSEASNGQLRARGPSLDVGCHSRDARMPIRTRTDTDMHRTHAMSLV